MRKLSAKNRRYAELLDIACGLAASIRNAYWEGPLHGPTLNMERYCVRLNVWLNSGLKK